MKVFLIFLVYSITSIASEEYKIVSFNYPPLIAKDSKGIVDLIVNEIEKTASVKLNLKKYPIKRSLKQFFNNVYPVHIGGETLFTQEQLKLLEVIPLFNYRIEFLYSRSLENMSKIKNIGILFGSNIEVKEFKDKGYTVISGKSMKETISLLVAGRIDAVRCIRIACALEMKRMNLNIEDYAFSLQNHKISRAAFFINKSHKDYKKISVILSNIVNTYLKSKSHYNLLERFFGKNIPEDYLVYTRKS